MDLTYDAYNFLYTTNDGERYDILEIKMIVPDEEDNEDMNNFSEYAHEVSEEVENNEIDDDDELLFYNGNNELVKIFIEPKCVICLENGSIFAFRNCGHLCLCESCFKSTDSDKLKKCIICKS